jgi:hypothetical protein
VTGKGKTEPPFSAGLAAPGAVCIYDGLCGNPQRHPLTLTVSYHGVCVVLD